MDEGMKVNDVLSRELQIICMALGAMRQDILREAAKFTDGSEQEYRAGMEQAAHMIRREIEQRER